MTSAENAAVPGAATITVGRTTDNPQTVTVQLRDRDVSDAAMNASYDRLSRRPETCPVCAMHGLAYCAAGCLCALCTGHDAAQWTMGGPR